MHKMPMHKLKDIKSPFTNREMIMFREGLLTGIKAVDKVIRKR